MRQLLAIYSFLCAWLILTVIASAADVVEPDGRFDLAGASRGGQEPVADASPARLPELRLEILNRARADQQARQALLQLTQQLPDSNLPEKQQAELDALAERVAEVDAENLEWMRQQVQRHGWPGVSLVGHDGAQAAWLLVQHADHDRNFQRKCLQLMRAAGEDEVSPTHIAYLTDRLLVAEGKKQMFGTQLEVLDEHVVLMPVHDPVGLNQRRRAHGLPPIDEYLEMVRQAVGNRDTL